MTGLSIGDTLSYLQLFFLLVVARFVYLLVYRLYLHPLKSFPGPRLAAVSDYFAAYFEVWKNGMFVQHLETLHEVYGNHIFRMNSESCTHACFRSGGQNTTERSITCSYEYCVRG